MSYWVNNSRRDVIMTEFFQMFCENILRFLIIIGMWGHLLQNKLTLLGCPESWHISFDATLCWICASKTDIGLSPPDGLLSNLSTWINANRVCLGVGFAAPSEFAVMLRLMWAITFDAFGTLDSAWKGRVPPLPTIFALGDSRVHVGSLNGRNVVSDVKAPVN